MLHLFGELLLKLQFTDKQDKRFTKVFYTTLESA